MVDDELPVLKLVTRILATDNYEITSADSGEMAARLMQQPGFPGVDLLVTDLQMPGMNGRELAAVVRQSNPQVRVSYVTGFADTLFKGVNELGSAESFIEKPFGADGILEATRLLMFGQISKWRSRSTSAMKSANGQTIGFARRWCGGCGAGDWRELTPAFARELRRGKRAFRRGKPRHVYEAAHR